MIAEKTLNILSAGARSQGAKSQSQGQQKPEENNNEESFDLPSPEHLDLIDDVRISTNIELCRQSGNDFLIAEGSRNC